MLRASLVSVVPYRGLFLWLVLMVVLVIVGVIVGVDEDTAYSWPVCSLCGSDRLEMAPQKP